MTAPIKFWLWKNFVDGRPEYWAFTNPYPCHSGGDPMVLGEPCGYAILKDSINGRNRSQSTRTIRASSPANTSALAIHPSAGTRLDPM
jgi:hypothetical protein